jgi:hypothetical protein
LKWWSVDCRHFKKKLTSFFVWSIRVSDLSRFLKTSFFRWGCRRAVQTH